MLSFLINPLILFSLVRYEVIDRQLLDAYLLVCLVIFSYDQRSFWKFGAIIFAFTSMQLMWNLNYLWVLNFTILPLAILNRTTPIIPTKQFKRFIPFVASYVFIKTMVDLAQGQYVEGGDRIAGPFTSSLHLAYFCVVASCVVANLKIKYSKIIIASLFACAAASGSRIGALGTFLVLIAQYPIHIRIILIASIGVLTLTALSEYIRVISYIPEAEDIRIQGFVNFFDWVGNSEILHVIFGMGRMSYGAMGYRMFGETAFITESSFIMLLYCYGALGGYIYYYFANNTYKISKKLNKGYLLFIPVGFALISPFIDSAAILTMNMAMISCCIKAQPHIK
ncbi:hypothetical protein [Polynucleobacter yangtzensis]|uniref:Uncharacterized protein n=1 Tax=Polynucleobacter yangtzensis TaxID=1743159 RepID=A0ABM8CKS5_9BURK|nr:hypothetical protein [Polynucleobacter yangtzensis]BDT78443.1 hypothetical protein PKF032_03310 [Polynucleobacter yangtzensis]